MLLYNLVLESTAATGLRPPPPPEPPPDEPPDELEPVEVLDIADETILCDTADKLINGYVE